MPTRKDSNNFISEYQKVTDFLQDSSNYRHAFWLRHTGWMGATDLDPYLFNFYYEVHKQGWEDVFLAGQVDLEANDEILLRQLWHHLERVYQQRRCDQATFREAKKRFNRLARYHNIDIRIRRLNRHDPLNYGYQLCDLSSKSNDNIDNELTLARRRLRWRVNGLSLLFSVLVAVGEAIVAAHMAPVLFGAAATFFIVLACALVSNFIQFRRATASTFKEIAFDRVYHNSKGDNLKKSGLFSYLIIPVVLTTVIGSGLGFSLLSFHSALTSLPLLFSLSPVGLLILSGVLGFAGFLCLSSLFYTSLVTDIKNGIVYKLYEAYKKQGSEGFWNQLRTYFKSIFANVDGEITKWSVAATLAKKALVISAFVFVSISTFGMFNHVSYAVFHTVFHMQSSVAKIAALASAIFSAPVNGYFQYTSLETGLNLFIRAGKYCASFFQAPLSLSQPIATKSSAEDSPGNIPENGIMQLERRYSAFSFMLIAGCISMNGLGQGWGVTQSADVSLVHQVLHFVSRPVVKWANFFTKMFCSNGANFDAALATTHEGLPRAGKCTNSKNQADEKFRSGKSSPNSVMIM